jgi:rhamnogalacturonyl hydrolase YesR
LLRNWTLPDSENTTFATAASEQLDYLLNVAPRAPNGAISQRENQVQLWADFVYMAPPFIAYYGALEDESTGRDLLQTAYDQVRFYREVLYDQNVSLWRHIALGNGTDPTHWATGNAWAAAGSMRVLATIKRSRVASKMTQQQCDLEQWVGEILDGAWSFQVSRFSRARRKSSNTKSVCVCAPISAREQQPNGTLLNYIDQPNSFADSASTALMAAATFRFASITCNNTHIPAAIRALRLVQHSIDDQGWLFNMVDPLTFSSESPPGQHSPEGQSFVLLLEAAVAEWKWLQENGN